MYNLPIRCSLVASLVLLVLAPPHLHAQTAAAANPYPTRAPLSEYLMADPQVEIALARTAAPSSVSEAAEIMVLSPTGYSTAVQGSNGFVCMVMRAFSASTDFPEFFNPKNRSPICLNAAAARSYLPTIFLRTKLVIEGRSKPEIASAVSSAVDSGRLPRVEPGSMSYMMSKEQYLNDEAINWHPHLMWFVPGDDEKAWGANLDGSPVIAGKDVDARVTIFMVIVSKWSDGTPGPPIK